MSQLPRHITRLLLAPSVLLATLWAAGPAAAWYDAAWSYRKAITIDATRVENADQTDFPVMFAHTDPDLRTTANGGRVESASGWDIVVVAGTDSVRIDHEVERYDPSTGEIVIWARIPSLSASVDTDLFLYYGNGSVASSLENPAGVWSNGYEAVYHLGDDLLDSTPNGRHGTNGGSTDAPAIAGDGQDFEPISQVETGVWNVSGSALTVQAWARYPDFAQDDPRMISKAFDGDPQNHVFMLSLGGVGNRFPRLRVKTGTNDASGSTTLIPTAGGLTADTWHFLAGTYDGATMRVFTDGVEAGNTAKTGGIRQNAWETWIGNNPNNTTDANWGSSDATLDEVRVSSAVRTADWLRTEYNNLFSPGTFYTVGAQELQVSLPLVKRAFLLDGTPVPHGATLPTGTVVKFLVYADNPGPMQADASVQDVLDPGFVFRGGTARIDTTMASCASGTCTPAEEAAIYASVDARPPETDIVDGDAVSFQPGTTTLHAGDGAVANAPLDIPGGSVAALLFEVTVASAADNTATGDIADVAAELLDSNTFTINATALPLVKTAFLTDGTQLPSGATVASGTLVQFLIYVDNPTAVTASDVNIQDVLDPAFVYQPGTLRTDNSLATGAAEAAIYAAANAAAPLDDAVDGTDVAGITGATVSAGGIAGNAPLDASANAVWALLFTARVQ